MENKTSPGFETMEGSKCVKVTAVKSNLLKDSKTPQPFNQFSAANDNVLVAEDILEEEIFILREEYVMMEEEYVMWEPALPKTKNKSRAVSAFEEEELSLPAEADLHHLEESFIWKK